MTTEQIDYSIIHHSTMLSDNERLALFKKAVQTVVQSSNIVVDIGSGTGILAAYAAELASAVYAIEYYAFAENLAKKILSKSPYQHIKFLKANAFDVKLPENPDVLITETIGQIGPEENIVEICYDFFRRHPSIKHIIPLQLSLYAEFIDSHTGRTFIQNIIDGYLNASFAEFDYAWIQSDIEQQLSNHIFQLDLKDAVSLRPPILLAEYELGKTVSSTFKKNISIPFDLKEKLLHLYFMAKLSDDIILSSRFNHQNHWKHSFAHIPKNKESCIISYMADSGFIKIE